ncbi:histidine kinase dimerization/phosphoacceptor domain -containing protein [Mesorhizobium sp. WSM2239]|uniref:histidine kinase n=2 Tax=unclassified Mesorhizobium TaxID=325217 RepID=A0AAU8D6G0_9HYPH
MIAEHPKTPANSPEQGSAAEELRYRLRQQQLTGEYAYFALQTHDVQALLQEATRVCAEGLQSKMCKIMEYLPAEHQFLVRAGVGWKPGVVGQARVRADTTSPTGYAFKTGEPVISNHLEGESRFRTPALLAEHNVKRAINALIHSGGERFGVLEVDSPVEGRFTEADLVFVKGFANLIGVALERQRTEEALKQQENLLQDALRHQEFLTKEISHRVKNSLSMVASLLSMQSRATDDPALLQALADAQARVQTIARVHDQLWRRDDIRAVDLADYLGDLCDHIRASAPNHQLICDVASVSVPTDQAIPVGLLVNELITNAVKYAYPEGFGEVRLVIAPAEQEGQLCLEISDRGIGLPAGQDFAKSGGLGTKLVSTLSRQLGGEVQWQDAKPGTRFVMVFRPQKNHTQ